MTNAGKIMKLMLEKQGEIIAQTNGMNGFAIYPRGDTRCRPVGWLDQDVMDQLLAKGVITKHTKSYILAPSYRRREHAAKSHGRSGAFANQHRQLEARNIYHPDRIKRPARINAHLSVLTRLACKTDKNGILFLTPDEIEAAHRFASDYARSMMGALATQNYSGAAGRERRTVNMAENISISALDARKHVMEALEYVGPGLDKALTALCGSDMSMSALETAENWARGSGKTVLKLALSRLSAYYGCQVGIGAKRVKN